MRIGCYAMPSPKPATDSIFPKVDNWLKKSSLHQAVGAAMADPNEEWRSMTDALFVSVFPEMRDACFKFYAGEGPQLRKLKSEKQITLMENMILRVLSAAMKKVTTP